MFVWIASTLDVFEFLLQGKFLFYGIFEIWYSLLVYNEIFLFEILSAEILVKN